MKMESYIDNDTIKAKGGQAKKGVSLISFEKNKCVLKSLLSSQ